MTATSIDRAEIKDLKGFKVLRDLREQPEPEHREVKVPRDRTGFREHKDLRVLKE
jgi:hypothetical protein